jgi:hypothetical protein
MDEQEAFDALVRSYNEEYLRLLRTAADGGSPWLAASFEALRDQYELILVTHDVNALEFRVPAHPLAFRGNEQFLGSLGFSDADIRRIFAFLDLYRATTGRSLELSRLE